MVRKRFMGLCKNSINNAFLRGLHAKRGI